MCAEYQVRVSEDTHGSPAGGVKEPENVLPFYLGFKMKTMRKRTYSKKKRNPYKDKHTFINNHVYYLLQSFHLLIKEFFIEHLMNMENAVQIPRSSLVHLYLGAEITMAQTVTVFNNLFFIWIYCMFSATWGLA